MKFLKTTINEYEIEPLMLKWHMTVGRFVNIRKNLGINSDEYKQCFMCNKIFEDDFFPAFVSVKGVGNMFVCHECMDYVLKSN